MADSQPTTGSFQQTSTPTVRQCETPKAPAVITAMERAEALRWLGVVEATFGTNDEALV